MPIKKDIERMLTKCEVCEDLRSEADPGRVYDATQVGYLCEKHRAGVEL
jgi:hypothetical protein